MTKFLAIRSRVVARSMPRRMSFLSASSKLSGFSSLNINNSGSSSSSWGTDGFANLHKFAPRIWEISPNWAGEVQEKIE